ncbi:DUF7446 family protein [Listeria innocua]
MAYENLKLATAAISGDIYLTRILKNGVMSDNRRIITDEDDKNFASYVFEEGEYLEDGEEEK